MSSSTSGTTAPEPPATVTTMGKTTSSTSSTTTTTTLDEVDTGDVAGFAVSRIRIGDDEWLVAVADTPEERSRGLMGVRDLGQLDGMLFVWSAAAPRAFTMRNTLIPLDLAFFDSQGRFAELVSMVPCEAEPCPAYPSTGPARWAVEAPPGAFDGIPLGTLLDLSG